jgi:hypothetical protein
MDTVHLVTDRKILLFLILLVELILLLRAYGAVHLRIKNLLFLILQIMADFLFLP